MSEKPLFALLKGGPLDGKCEKVDWRSEEDADKPGANWFPSRNPQPADRTRLAAIQIIHVNDLGA